MAKNPKIDTSLPNTHQVVIGQSGAGKSTWMKRDALVAKGKRVLFFDPDHEYEVQRVTSVAEFVRRVKAGQGKPIRLALSCDSTPDSFAIFCATVRAALDARHKTVMVVDELADVTRIGKAAPDWGFLIRRGRKYGLSIRAGVQRPAECDKTVFSQCAYRWVGYTETPADQKRAAESIGVSVDEVASLKKLEYLFKTQDGLKRGKITFK